MRNEMSVLMVPTHLEALREHARDLLLQIPTVQRAPQLAELIRAIGELVSRAYDVAEGSSHPEMISFLDEMRMIEGVAKLAAEAMQPRLLAMLSPMSQAMIKSTLAARKRRWS